MGMAAILVMWPGPFEQTFVPPSWGVFIWNLSSIGPAVSEEKMFENVAGRRTMDTGVIGIQLAHPWAFGSGELKIIDWDVEKQIKQTFSFFSTKTEKIVPDQTAQFCMV